MELYQYLFMNKMTATDFAKLIGCSPEYMRKVVKYKVIPSIFLAKTIENETKMEVNAEDLVRRAKNYQKTKAYICKKPPEIKTELKKYMIENNLNSKKLGEMIGYDGSVIRKIAAGTRGPSKKFVELIKKFTNGALEIPYVSKKDVKK